MLASRLGSFEGLAVADLVGPVPEAGFGQALQDAALALQLKVQTVRTYLKQIFQKTGTHRQAELMQLMLSGALPVLD